MDKDKVTLTVLREDGWKYGKNIFELGDQFTVSKEDLPHLQKYLDDGTCEVDLDPRPIDAKKAGEIQAAAVKTALEPFLGEVKESFRNLKLHDRYNNDPEYVDKGGFSNFAEFAKDVYVRDTNRGSSEKLKKWESSDICKAATSMGEAITSDGGALVPTAFRNQLLMNNLESSIVFPRATSVPMASNAIEIPSIEVSSHASTFFGGVVAYWQDEGTSDTAAKPATGRVSLKLNSLKAYAVVTDELLQDSAISLEGILPPMFSQALSFQMDQKFLSGAGAGCPLGVISAPCTVSQAKETGQAATTIVAENIIKMYSRMYPPSTANAVWVANIDTFPQLATLSIAVGTGGGLVGLLSNQQAQASPTMTLLGRPVIFTEKLPTLGTVGDIIFADFSQYIIASKTMTGSTMQSSIHLKFDQHETAFRMMMRMDGQPWWKSALTPRVSTTTLSPFVTLATRS